MSKFLWYSTSSMDPHLYTNWLKDDGTTTAAPTASDDLYVQAIPGRTLANIWASGGQGGPPTVAAATFTASTGGNLLQSTTYRYYVTAIYADGESSVSNEASVAIGATGTNTNKVTVTWVAPVGSTPTGYKIYRGTTSGTELYIASVGVVLTYIDTAAVPGIGAPPGFVTYTSLNVSQTFGGTIGIAGFNGYWTVSATTINIGTPGAGNSNVGSGRIKLNPGTIQYTAYVYNTASSPTDTGYEPVIFLGTHASNVLNVMSGTVGVATANPGETAVVATLSATGNTTSVRTGSGVTLTTVNSAGGADIMINSAATTVAVDSTSGIATYGSGAITTVSLSGKGTLNSIGTLTTLQLYPGATADFSGNPAARTVTTLNQYQNSTLKVSPNASGVASHLTITNRNFIEVGTLATS